jgi:hypothetical protein
VCGVADVCVERINDTLCWANQVVGLVNRLLNSLPDDELSLCRRRLNHCAAHDRERQSWTSPSGSPPQRDTARVIALSAKLGGTTTYAWPDITQLLCRPKCGTPLTHTTRVAYGGTRVSGSGDGVMVNQTINREHCVRERWVHTSVLTIRG